MAQTAITLNPAVAQAGTFASTEEGTFSIRSRRAAETITPGKFVVQAADAEECEQPDSTGEVTDGHVLGIALIDSQSSTLPYAVDDTVRIAHGGEIWVDAEDAVAAGDPVFVRFADAGVTGLGSARSDADTADAVACPNAIWASTTAAAGLAKVRLGGVFS